MFVVAVHSGIAYAAAAVKINEAKKAVRVRFFEKLKKP